MTEVLLKERTEEECGDNGDPIEELVKAFFKPEHQAGMKERIKNGNISPGLDSLLFGIGLAA